MHHRNIISLLQLLILLLLCFFSAMIYWSYLVQEEVLLRIERAVPEVSHEVLSAQKETASPLAKDEYVNLLTPDPFTTQVLPKLRSGKKAEGIYRLGTYGKPENLSPFSLWSDVNDWYGLCVGSVGRLHVGFYDAFGPDLAWKVEKREVPETGLVEFCVHLREAIFWEPLEPHFFPTNNVLSDHFLKRRPVVAEDFLFFWNSFQNRLVDFPLAVTLRNLYAPFKGLRVVNSKTFVVEIEKVMQPDGTQAISFDAPQMVFALRPLPRWVYLYNQEGTQLILEEDVQKSSNFAQHITSHFALNVIPSCNAWIFDGFTEEKIGFQRNQNYVEPCIANWCSMSIRFYSTPDGMFRDFLSKNLDLSMVPREKLSELKNKDMKTLTYPARAYYYIGLNNQHPILRSKLVRQALDCAVDEKRLIEQVLYSQGISCNGPFLPTSGDADPTIVPRPYSQTLATELLAQDGWKEKNSQGILEKEINGQKVPLSFSLIYFANIPIAKGLCELIALQLHEVGVDCRLRGVETAELSQAIENKSFDAYLLGWAVETPPEKIEQLWHSNQAHVKGSSNTVGFMNARVDALAEALKYEDDPEKRKAMYHEVHQIIFDETPYIFLYFDMRTVAFWDFVKMVFIPKDRQDLCPGAEDSMPQLYFSYKE